MRNVRDFAGVLALDKVDLQRERAAGRVLEKGRSTSSMRALSTRDIASMRGMEHCRIPHCAGFMGATMCMRVCVDGSRSNRG